MRIEAPARMNVEDDLVLTRSNSSLSLSSQSTRYTELFGDDDISVIIAQVPDDEDNFSSITFNATDGPGLTQAVQDAKAGSKRKCSPEDDQGSSRPPKKSSFQSSSSGIIARNSVATASIETLVDPVPSGSSATSFAVPPKQSAQSLATLVPHASNISAHDFTSPRPVIVTHSLHYTKWLQRLPWGVQWEIARYVNTGFEYERFTIDMLNRLISLGKNASAAPEVTKFVERERKAGQAGPSNGVLDGPIDKDSAEDEFAAAYAREQSARLPWEELDEEESILRDRPYGALGCNHDQRFLNEDPDWYGGKVHFTAKVVVAKDRSKDEFRFVLDRPTLGSSCRFMRRFGSRRFVRALIQKDALMQKGAGLAEYFRRPFVIGGEVFRAFFAKEQNVFLLRTNEVVVVSKEGVSIKPPPKDHPNASGEFSFMEFIKWHNDLDMNSEQTMAKWAARFALGLSNSVPGVRLECENVKFEDDIICSAFDGTGKPPSEMQMTDGCGFANRAVMRALHAKFPSWHDEPTAIQCRIGGAKGLLLVRHDLTPDEEEHPTIWLRPSQTKIKYSTDPLHECILPEDTDPAMLTLDVLRASRMKCPARLSVETITNFAENGVPFKYFSDLLEVNVHERVKALLDWDGLGDSSIGGVDPNAKPSPNPAAMKLLWNALAKEGGVMAARMARENSGTARAAGYVAEDQEDEWEDEDGLSQLDKALHEQSSAWWEDPISGCPSSLEETCMTLLDSGFTPDKCIVLRAKLKEVAKKIVKTFQTRFQFEVPMSCSAFIVPDPYGVLGPGEIHVKSSRRNLPDAMGRLTDLVLGDVLVTRHPCKVPSDVQKVRAVFHDRLRHYCDVIVVSTESHTFQGESLNRHLASLTGGGDYDGDTMEVFWDPAIVQAFKPPDPRLFGVEPPQVRTCLQKSAESVRGFLSQIPSSASEGYWIHSLQRYLLGALQDKSLVGQYSTWWENSTYAKGYSHSDTIFLAYMFCAILDGSKTGVTVIPAAYDEHCKNRIWQARCPAWKESGEERQRQDTLEMRNGFMPNLKRPRHLPKFVMDELRDRIDKVCDAELALIDRRLPTTVVAPRDDALAGPWDDAKSRATKCPIMQEDLKKIEQHVKAMFDKERKLLTTAAATAGKGNKSKKFTELPIERRQDLLRELSREFHSKPSLDSFDAASARRVKASYAYIYDYDKAYNRWTRFPWDVATRALCEIKAEALGFPKTVSANFYHCMTVSSAYVRKHS